MFSSPSKLRIWFACILLALLAAACTPPTAAAPTVRIESPASAAQVNDTVRVAVKAANVNNLTAFEAHLAFDANMLEVVELVAGDFVKADFSVQNKFDNTAGTIDYAIAQINRDPAQGSGVLFEIVFRAKAAGSSPIRFRSTEAAPTGVLLSDPNGTAIQVAFSDGNVNIK